MSSPSSSSSESESDDEVRQIDSDVLKNLTNWNKEQDCVEVLKTLALKCIMKSLLKVVSQNVNDYEDIDQAKTEKMEKIFTYHEPHRQFLACTNLMETCSAINFYLFDQNFESGILGYCFWCCLENTESQELYISDNRNSEELNSLKLEFISKSKSDFARCNKLKLQFQDDLTNQEQILSKGRFIHVNNLSIDFDVESNCCSFISRKLENFQKLKTLKIKFSGFMDVHNFYQCAQKMEKEQLPITTNLEQLHMDTWRCRDNVEASEEEKVMDEIFKSVKVFKNLRVFQLRNGLIRGSG